MNKLCKATAYFKRLAEKLLDVSELLSQALMGDRDSFLVLLDLIQEEKPEFFQELENANGLKPLEILSKLFPNIIKASNRELSGTLYVFKNSLNIRGINLGNSYVTIIYPDYKIQLYNNSKNIRVFDLYNSNIKEILDHDEYLRTLIENEIGEYEDSYIESDDPEYKQYKNIVQSAKFRAEKDIAELERLIAVPKAINKSDSANEEITSIAQSIRKLIALANDLDPFYFIRFNDESSAAWDKKKDHSIERAFERTDPSTAEVVIKYVNSILTGLNKFPDLVSQLPEGSEWYVSCPKGLTAIILKIDNKLNHATTLAPGHQMRKTVRGSLEQEIRRLYNLQNLKNK